MNIKDLTDNDILSNALRFSFDKCPKDEKGAMDADTLQKYKGTFMSCVKWLKENYQPACKGFLNEVETK